MKLFLGDFVHLIFVRLVWGDFANLIFVRLVWGDFANLIFVRLVWGDFVHLLCLVAQRRAAGRPAGSPSVVSASKHFFRFSIF